jgi:thiol:disulfide interchange protein DsbA
MRLPRRFSGLLCAAFLMLAACGGESPPATSETATEAPKVAAQPGAPSSAPAAPIDPLSTDVAASEETAPAQISETDEETPAEQAAPAAATPTLKLAAVAAPPPASRFQEGVHYRRLSPTQPTSVSPGQVEVIEVFWYGCAACFAIEPKLESWLAKTKPAYAVFERIPATWNDITRFHGRVFYTAEALGKLDALHGSIFRELHVANNPLNTAASVSALFAERGVGKAEFQKAFGSFGVDSKMQRADVLNRRYRVQGTPSFVVNGKFTTDVAAAGGEDALFTLLGELIARERGN